jgi:hypothetical protein
MNKEQKHGGHVGQRGVVKKRARPGVKKGKAKKMGLMPSEAGGIEFGQFVTWAFLSLLCGIAGFIVNVLSKMQHAMEKLNVHVTTLLAHHENQKDKNAEYNRRIEKLEESSLANRRSSSKNN